MGFSINDYFAPWPKMDFSVPFASLTDAGWWRQRVAVTVGTMVWIIVAQQAGASPFAWGLSYAVASAMFSADMNCLDSFRDFLTGKGSLGKFLGLLPFQILAGLLVNSSADVFGHENVADVADNSKFFSDWELFKIILAKETLGVFFYYVISTQAKNNSQVPEQLWSAIMVAMAFHIGSDGFAFAPAHNFVLGFGNTCSGAITLILQLIAVVLACLINHWFWPVREFTVAEQVEEKVEEVIEDVVEVVQEIVDDFKDIVD